MNVYFKPSVEILYGRSTLNVKNIRQGLDLLLPDNRKTKKKWIYLMMAWHSMDFLISIQRDNSQELVSSILELYSSLMQLQLTLKLMISKWEKLRKDER